jgi:hypothetical protein
MKFVMYYKKTPNVIQQRGDFELDNFNFRKFLKKNFPEGRASLTQLKNKMPLKVFKQYLKKTNTIYIGVNDKEMFQ